MKRIHIVLEDEEYEKLKRLKDSLRLNWKELFLKLAEEYEGPSGSCINDLKFLYKSVAKLLSQIGKMASSEEVDNELYLASLFPLIVIGEEVEEKEIEELIILLINDILTRLKVKYREVNANLYLLFETLRIALIRELRGDTANFIKFMRTLCENLKRLEGEQPPL